MRLEELRKLAEARTKGEWVPIIAFIDEGYSTLCPTADDKQPATSADLKFIAAMANNIDKLLDLWEAAKFNHRGGHSTPELWKALEALENA